MIDAHLHLLKIEDTGYKSPDDIGTNLKKNWDEMDRDTLKKLLFKLTKEINENGFKKGLLYILDEEWYKHKWFPIKFPQDISVAMTLSPFCENLDEKLDILLRNNIKIIKILPYEQKIMRSDYNRVLELAKKIEGKSMVLTICCAYGSKYVYDTNGVELAAYLLNNGIKSPIIMAHGGMVKVFDAMSLMLEFPNLYMDISFTLPYWWGSRIIEDYAFVLKKLSYERVFYGSDSPYVDMKTSYDYFQKFCNEFKISNTDVNKILYMNFETFLLENILTSNK